jgi:hypothetical protein
MRGRPGRGRLWLDSLEEVDSSGYHAAGGSLLGAAHRVRRQDTDLMEAVMLEHDPDPVEAIRRRAHEISLGPDAGTPEENWLRAEEELHRPTVAEDAIRREEETVAEETGLAGVAQGHLSALTHP